jgi:hypothetical protein
MTGEGWAAYTGGWLFFVALSVIAVARGSDAYVVAAGVVSGFLASIQAAWCLYATIVALIRGSKS